MACRTVILYQTFLLLAISTDVASPENFRLQRKVLATSEAEKSLQIQILWTVCVCVCVYMCVLCVYGVWDVWVVVI